MARASSAGGAEDGIDPGGEPSERERVIAALERAGWVQARAARLLGMTPRQIAYRVQILNIEDEADLKRKALREWMDACPWCSLRSMRLAALFLSAPSFSPAVRGSGRLAP
jgi:hypothetical protein